jgi:hypothetical protein
MRFDWVMLAGSSLARFAARFAHAVFYALAFFWLDGFAVPAPAPVTQTVRWRFPKLRRAQHQFGIIGDNCEEMIFRQRIFTNE